MPMEFSGMSNDPFLTSCQPLFVNLVHRTIEPSGMLAGVSIDLFWETLNARTVLLGEVRHRITVSSAGACAPDR
jgi:hypothetical protein